MTYEYFNQQLCALDYCNVKIGNNKCFKERHYQSLIGVTSLELVLMNNKLRDSKHVCIVLVSYSKPCT